MQVVSLVVEGTVLGEHLVHEFGFVLWTLVVMLLDHSSSQMLVVVTL